MAAGSKIYANAVAKYNEGKLLDEEKLKRVSDASYYDAIKMLYDYGYGEGLPIENADAEKLAGAELEKLISFVEEYAQNEKLKAFLLLPFLYNNLKAAYKSGFASVSENAFYPFFHAETEAVKTKEYNSLSQIAAEGLKRLDDSAAEGKITSREIDCVLTGCMYKELKSLSSGLKRSLRKYVSMQIDLKNILTAFRARKQNVDFKIASAMLIEGGNLKEEQLKAIASADPDSATAMFDGEYHDYVKKLFETGDFVEFERETDEILYELSTRNRENMTSSEPFTGYFFAKLTEIKTVKLILTCLKNNARDEIGKRLRRVYG